MFLEILSNQNENVKMFKSLATMKKARKETGLFVIEGKKLIAEAFNANWEITHVIAQANVQENPKEVEFLSQIEKKGAKIFLASKAAIEVATSTQSPQNIVAAAKMQTSEFALPKNGFFVGLDRIQDPGNFGTIIRSADAFGVDGILCSLGCADIFSPKVIRSCAGSIFHVPVYNVDLEQICDNMIKNDYDIIAAELSGTQNLPEKIQRAMLLIGSEGQGLCEQLVSKATIRYKLEMRGRAESLNAAVCAGIIINELTKRI